jgi:hypothetical protein
MKSYKLKDYPKKISVADKALRYSDERFVSVFRAATKRVGIVATDAEILAWRDAEKAKRFPKSKAKAKIEKPKPEKKPEKQKEPGKKETKKTAGKQ